MTIPQALTIAGSDSGGGAGIQADIKTMQMRGVFATSVITAITAQNTCGVNHIEMASTASVRAQIAAIAADFTIRAHKIGMLGTADMIACVAASLRDCNFGALVLDPVMIAKGGAPLLQSDAIAALKRELLPRATLITPNLPEAEQLAGIRISNDADIARAAHILRQQGAHDVLIKGGHGQGDTCRDWLFHEGGTLTLDAPRHATPHTHGTGCTLSACITAELAKGATLTDAVRTAKAYISAAIARPLNIGHGHGPVNHWAYDET